MRTAHAPGMQVGQITDQFSGHWPTPRRTGIWAKLVAPTRPAASTDDDRRARLLAVLSLAMGVMAGVGAVQSALFAPPEIAIHVWPVLSLATLGYAAGYVLARRARTRMSALVTVGVQLTIPVAVQVGLGGAAVDPMSAAAWMSLALLTANTTLGPRAVLIIGATAIFELILALRILHAPIAETAESACLLASMTIALFVYARHRDALETARQKQLRGRNTELEALRSTLEERVQARTAELATSTAALRTTCESLEANQALLLRTEKMAAVGRLTAGFAHELASPLSALLATLDDLKGLRNEYAQSIGDQSVTPEDHRSIASEMSDALSLAHAASERAITFVRGIRAQTREPGVRAVEKFDAGQVTVEAVELLGYLARSAGVRLVAEKPSEPVVVLGVPSRLNQAVTNLVQNAIDAAGERGGGARVSVSVAAEVGCAVIRVSDDGPGIAPHVLPRIFEVLFTTKPYGKGTGLGLSIVHEIVRDELEGDVEVDTKVGVGTTFTVRFPLDPGGHHGA